MFLLIGNKLFVEDLGKYTSVDIINGEIVKNDIETTTDTRDGQLLTYREVYCKFHINTSVPTLSKEYLFPRTQNNQTSSSEINNDGVQADTKKTSSTKAKK